MPGYTRARPAGTWKSKSEGQPYTRVRKIDLEKWDQAIYEAKRNYALDVRDYLPGGAQSFVSGTTDIWQPLLDAVDDLPITGGKIMLPHGEAGVGGSLASALQSKQNVHIFGAGKQGTILYPQTSSGYLFDNTGVGRHTYENFTIDGTDCTGTACAMRFYDGASIHVVRDLLITNFLNTSDQYPLMIQGAEDLRFYNLEMRSNSVHLCSRDRADHSTSSTEIRFWGPIFQDAQWAGGAAVLLQDAESHLFMGGACQANLGLVAIGIVNTLSGATPSRKNVIYGMHFEDNGGGQSGSHSVHAAGLNTGAQILVGTVVRDSFFGSSGADKPSSQMFFQNTRGSIVDGCYDNLGSPTKAIEDGGGNSNFGYGVNDFAGVVDAGIYGAAPKKPQARVTKSALQAIPNATETLINFDAERYDTNAIHDNSTNNTRLTCRTPGRYRISGYFSFTANAAGWRMAKLLLNGATIIDIARIDGSGNATIMRVDTEYDLAVGDYVELLVYQNSGVSLDVEKNANYSPEFMMSLV